MTDVHSSGGDSVSLPFLCVDTCSLLDTMRTPTRDKVTVPEREAIIRLLCAAEDGLLLALMAPRVRNEFRMYDRKVLEETRMSVELAKNVVLGIEKVDAVYGGTDISNLLHLDGHHVRAHAITCRWIEVMQCVDQTAEVERLAKIRMMQGLAPASNTRTSEGDCIIVQTYLEAIRAIRDSGNNSIAVFISSNINDYAEEDMGVVTGVKRELGELMAPLNFHYAQNFREAADLLVL